MYETENRLLENPDGASGYSQVATIITGSSSYDLVVSLPELANASYILQACDNGTCTDSNEVFILATLANAIGYFKASNTGESDFLVAVSLCQAMVIL